MAFSEAERVQIRRWLGYPAIVSQAVLRLENAITLAQSVADGGGRPDNSTELAVRGYLAQLVVIDTALTDSVSKGMALRVDGSTDLDYARRYALAARDGRRLVGELGDVLDTSPIRDVFGPRTVTPDAYDARWSQSAMVGR